MARLILGKFTIEEQYQNNYYHADGPNYLSWIGELKVADYVMPCRLGTIKNLLKCSEINDSGNDVRCKFEVVKEYNPPITLSGNLARSRYLALDINLLNKCYKSTRGTSFHRLPLTDDNISPVDIDFTQKIKFYCVVETYLDKAKDLLHQHDLVIVIDNVNDLNIVSINEYSDFGFKPYPSLWNLYLSRTLDGTKYSLNQLLEFASPENDDAPNKFRYLSKLIKDLKANSFYAIDKMVTFYDNVLVGRRRTISPKEDIELVTDAFEDVMDVSDAYQEYVDLLNFNPNLLLYGVPGTGKTYSISKIIEAYEISQGRLPIYREVEKENRVKFVTFHQNYSYEEFIEGLRPETDDNGQIKYNVKSGVLKTFIESNRIQDTQNTYDSALHEQGINPNNQVWRLSLGTKSETKIYEYFTKNDLIGIGHDAELNYAKASGLDKENANKTLKRFADDLANGDIVCIYNDSKSIRRVGIVVGDYFYSDEGIKSYPHRRKVNWIKNFENNPLDIFTMNNGVLMTTGTLYKLQFSVVDLLERISPYSETNTSKTLTKTIYLVIDEINRGNVSKIFGELITLIEKDKRGDYSTVLPYSQTKFTIPKNLIILGTMNTSDRSIALLDVALRRRFTFIELTPNLQLLDNINPTISGNVSPSLLLYSLNRKITDIIDRDHIIGHSYFMIPEMTKEDLYHVWYYQIVPLLIEYFYYDFKKLSEIIRPFVDENKKSIIYFDRKSDEYNLSKFERALMSLYQ